MSSTVMRPFVTDADVTAFFGNTINGDFFRLMCGQFLGGGVGRGVYVLASDRTKVVKIETQSQSFQNVMEWEVWTAVKVLVKGRGLPISRWFAPCHAISQCGVVMVQSRTWPLEKSRFPKKMPGFFTDFKYQNFGLIGRQLVAHDYGYNRLIHLGATNRMRVANWHDDSPDSKESSS